MFKELKEAGVIQPPSWLTEPEYVTLMGGQAYQTSTDSSDIDLYGFCIPPIEFVHPYKDKIYGFGSAPALFDQFLAHQKEWDGKVYDIQIFNIVKFYDLTMSGNPNMLDALFTPDDCLMMTSRSAKLTRDNKYLFLSKQAIKKTWAWANSNRHKLITKKPGEGSKRKDMVAEWGFDLKYSAHLVRIADNALQICDGDLNIRNISEQVREIRAGKWSLEKVLSESGKILDEVDSRLNSGKVSVPDKADEKKIELLLRDCLNGIDQ